MSIILQKELYEKPDSILVRSHSLTNISNVTIQIVADAQQNREGHFFPLIQFRPCPRRKIKLLSECGLLYVSIKQEHPKFLIAYPHDIHPFTNSLITTIIFIIHENLFNCNHLMHKFTRKMQVYDGFSLQKRQFSSLY